MPCLFRCKMFSEKCFWYLVGIKIVVNENYFQFDRKIFFNFWNTNRKSFSGFKLFILARTFVGIRHNWSLLVTRLYRQISPNFSIELPESDQYWRNPVSTAGFWHFFGILASLQIRFLLNWPESDQYSRITAFFSEFRPVWSESRNLCQNLAKYPEFDKYGQYSRILAVLFAFRLVWPKSENFCWNPTTLPDYGKQVSSQFGQNPTTTVGRTSQGPENIFKKVIFSEK
jgi:hypothetical protein